MNHKRIERLWRREGLKVPQRQPKRRRLWFNDGACVRLRPTHRDHVWSYDFAQARTHDGCAFRMLTVIDEFNRDSGEFRGRRMIWGGRAGVRSALYMATLTARTYNPVIRRFAQRPEGAGKPFKLVLIACMRKLLVILNTMLRDQIDWNPKLLPQSP